MADLVGEESEGLRQPNDAMNILIYAHQYIEPENRKNIHALSQMANVRLVTPTSGPASLFETYPLQLEDREKGIVLGFKNTSLFTYQYVLNTISFNLGTFCPEVIVVDYNPWSLMFLQALTIRTIFFPRAQIICSVKKNTFYARPGLKGRVKSMIARWCLRRCDHLIAASEVAKRMFVQKFSCKEEAIHVCTNLAVDIDRFNPNKETIGGDCRARSIVIGYCGRFDADKGIADLIEAMQILRESETPFGAELRLLGCGCGCGSKSMEEDVRRIAEHCTWLTAFPRVEHREVPEFLRSLDIFVLPSRITVNHQEHDAQALLEALACGIPCIGTVSGIIPEILSDGAGVLVDCCAPAALGGAIAKLAENREYRASLSQIGRERVEIMYSLATVAKRRVDILRRLVDAKE